MREELPKLKLGRLRLWREVKVRNRRSGPQVERRYIRREKASGRLTIGDKKEIDKARWSKPRGISFNADLTFHFVTSYFSGVSRP